jgi:hypothetical protein
MGRLQAQALVEDTDIPLETQIRWHLATNHYPSIPEIMVKPCLEAIDKANEGDWEARIDLPIDVTWKGWTYATVSAIVEAHHLDAWITEEEYY